QTCLHVRSAASQEVVAGLAQPSRTPQVLAPRAHAPMRPTDDLDRDLRRRPAEVRPHESVDDLHLAVHERIEPARTRTLEELVFEVAERSPASGRADVERPAHDRHRPTSAIALQESLHPPRRETEAELSL